MINQQVGDLLEIQFENRWYYLIVLTKRVMFGGNIVFAFHTSGDRTNLSELLNSKEGFNVCVDLLYPKKRCTVTRIHKFADVASFFLTKFVKGCHAHRPGEKAWEWFVYRMDDLRTHFLRTPKLASEHIGAMDHACFSFDLVAKKILQKYTPSKNEHI
jgi:hypothetical protein